MTHQSSPIIGRALGTLRERRGVPLKRVCRITGLSFDTVRAVETGRSQPSIDTLDRIARALGTTLVEVARTEWDGRQAANGDPLSVGEIARAVVALPASVGSKLAAVRAAAILRVMEMTGDNQSAGARLLGMERKAFVRGLAKARRKRR